MSTKSQSASLAEIIADLGISEQELDHWSDYAMEGLGRFYTDFHATGVVPAHLAQSFRFAEQLYV